MIDEKVNVTIVEPIKKVLEKHLFLVVQKDFTFDWSEKFKDPIYLCIGDTFTFTITVRGNCAKQSQVEELTQGMQKQYEELLAEYHKRLPPDQQAGVYILGNDFSHEEKKEHVLSTFPCECGSRKLGLPGHSDWCPRSNLAETHWAYEIHKEEK